MGVGEESLAEAGGAPSDPRDPPTLHLDKGGGNIGGQWPGEGPSHFWCAETVMGHLSASREGW